MAALVTYQPTQGWSSNLCGLMLRRVNLNLERYHSLSRKWNEVNVAVSVNVAWLVQLLAVKGNFLLDEYRLCCREKASTDQILVDDGDEGDVKLVLVNLQTCSI